MKQSHKIRGTDESFSQLMQLTGGSLLKLLGYPQEVAESYQFRAVIFKRKRLEPDSEGIPALESGQGRIFLEFQGYRDPLIRCRLASEILHACITLPDDKPINGAIVYTDAAYQKAALPVKKRAANIECAFQEIVLSRYSETELLRFDPRLAVLTPFTIAKNTAGKIVADKAIYWHAQVCEAYDEAQRSEALNILSLFLFDRFRKLGWKEVKSMLNLDWTNNPLVQEIWLEGKREGKLEGKLEGKREGKREGKLEGELRGEREMLIEVLRERFTKVPVTLAKKVEAVESTQVLKALLRSAIHCKDLKEFKNMLASIQHDGTGGKTDNIP